VIVAKEKDALVADAAHRLEARRRDHSAITGREPGPRSPVVGRFDTVAVEPEVPGGVGGEAAPPPISKHGPSPEP
jgi:hypothetical protein